MRVHILLIIMAMGTGALASAYPRMKALPLDMAPNSVDDRYSHCTEEMSKKVLSEYLPSEKNSNAQFKKAWNSAANKNQHKYPDNGLTVNHVIAIRLYVDGQYRIYEAFNADVRDGGGDYEAFKYHALHFFLTHAIQKLKENQKRCVTTYRGVGKEFDKNRVLNKEIRLGSFTSTSLDENVARRFANGKSLFEIYTCQGAALGKFSPLQKREEEVLIPPYEKFKVVGIVEKRKEGEIETVHKLESTGIQSNWYPKELVL